MQDFNLLNLLAMASNLAKNNLAMQKNQQAQNLPNQPLGNNLQNLAKAQNNSLNSQGSFQTLKSTYNQIFETNSVFNISKMNMETTNKYLQSLLELPENLNLFLESAKNETTEKLAKLIVQDLFVNKNLASLLLDNSKEGIDKVLKAISNSFNCQNVEIAELKEVLNILKSIHQSASATLASLSGTSTSQAQVTLNLALKELFLLYIPLNIQAFENSSTLGLSGEEEGIAQNSTLAIFFETLNFQNIYASILDSENGIFLTLYSSEDFPKEKFEKIVKLISEKINLNFQVEYRKMRLVKDFNYEIQNFKVFSNSLIPLNILYFSHILIETIFKIDSSFSEAI